MRNFLFLLTILISFYACSPSKHITAELKNASESLNNKEYEVSYTHYKNIISELSEKGKNISADTYANAGYVAAYSTNYVDAKLWLDKASSAGNESAEKFLGEAKLYQFRDNLSMEIYALNNLVLKYPSHPEIEKIKCSLFEAYIRSENWEKAFSLLPVLQDKYKNSQRGLEKILQLHIALNNENAQNIAENLLKKNASSEVALEYLAYYYFKKGQDMYLLEMKKYEATKTRKQYNILVKKLDEVNTYYKNARDKFLLLYNLNPQKKYAGILSNIYKQLNNEEKSRYFEILSR